jgi:PAS domain S-box-containing protein
VTFSSLPEWPYPNTDDPPSLPPLHRPLRPRASGAPTNRLETRLVGTYVALTILITLMSLAGGRLIQRYDQRQSAAQAALIQGTEQLLSLAGSISEEGFSYVFSADPKEAENALAELTELEKHANDMQNTDGLDHPTAVALAGIEPVAERMRAAAKQMFESFRTTGGVPKVVYESYDASIDELSGAITTLRAAVTAELAAKTQTARRTSDWLTFVTGVCAVLAGLLIGRMFGRRLTRPIVALRNAATTFGVERSIPPIPVESGDEVGELTLAFNEMVVQTRRYLQTIARGEQRLNDIFASMGEMLLVCDAQGLIVDVNPVACRLSGYAEPDLLGRFAGAIFARDDLFPRLEGSVVVSPRECDASLKTATGLEIAVRLVVSKLRGGQDGWVCIAQDLTARQRLELELRQAHKMDAIGRLAGGIAHDFNNMLSIILGYAVFLLDGRLPTDPLYGPLTEMKIAGERSADLTRQLLAFGRQSQVLMGRVNFAVSVETTAKMVRRILPENTSVTVTNDPMARDVEAAPGQVEQVLMNLVINARDAMPNGGTIAIASTFVQVDEVNQDTSDHVPVGAYMRLCVTDSGTGMDGHTLERIFEPFFTTKEQGKGTGLGLSSVFGVVQQCKGHIFVESALGRGTTFRVFFPAFMGDPASLESAEKEGRTRIGAAPGLSLGALAS